MNAFYPGLHQASDAQHFERCCIHAQRLAARQKPLGCDDLLVDSQAFRVLEIHGDHVLSEIEYARRIEKISRLCPKVTAVTQDYMCEQYIFDCREQLTGVRYTIADHQRLTIERYDAIRNELDSSIYLMPVLQGYAVAEYLDHIQQYGERLAYDSWVGVGSVCKRNGNMRAIEEVLFQISEYRPDLKLHGFGVKTTALESSIVRSSLYSADSMAWSFAARKARRAGDMTRSANDWREAETFTTKIKHQRVKQRAYQHRMELV